MMTSSPPLRLSGLALLAGAVAFVAHVAARSAITAGAEPGSYLRGGLWVAVNALGALGAALVLLGLPGAYARPASSGGLPGLIGIALIAVAWMFFGVFLSLYGALVAPWLADQAPALVAASATIPAAFVVAFLAGLAAQLAGTALLAIPFLRGRARPRWIGYLLPASAIWTVAGDLLAPSGPAANLALNLLSNLGPVLQLAALAELGRRTWLERAPAEQTAPGDGPVTPR
jgi:hypothetical protein